MWEIEKIVWYTVCACLGSLHTTVLHGSYEQFQFAIFLQSDTTATIFSMLVFVWLVFEGNVYFYGKATDINDGWIRYA